MSQVTIISGVERRRRWSAEQKRALVTAISEPGANVAEIARRADLRPSQIYRWRRELERGPVGFAAVMVGPDPSAVMTGGPAILIELPGGGRVSIASSTPPALAAAALKALR